jgi:hypothetical protein
MGCEEIMIVVATMAGEKLRLSCNQREGCSLMRIVHGRQCLSEDMGNDLIPKGEESIFVGFSLLMKMER